MSKLSNILVLLQILQNKRKYSIKELSEKLEVTPRMVRKYKEELEYAGIYIAEKFIKTENIKPYNKKYYNLLSKAINDKSKCYIEYYSKERDAITKRVIRPYNLIILDNEWGVAAYCEIKEEIRHFYLSRIKFIKNII